LKNIFTLFCEAMGMILNVNKSVILLPFKRVDYKNLFTNLLNFLVQALSEESKYLGFMLIVQI